MKNRILVTGAAGFIGSSLTDRLLLKNYKVLGLDNFDNFYDRSVKEGNLAQALRNRNFSLREGDIRDVQFVDDTFSGFYPDIVIHLAAKAGVTPSLNMPEAYYSVNVMGTLTILEAMRKFKTRNMIFASSSSVYGNNPHVPFSESDVVDYPISPYAASKKAGELLCYTYHHLYGFNIFCMRFFTVYGPRQRPDLAICKFVRSVLSNAIITIYGDGSSKRDYTHIHDIVDGIESAIRHLKGYEIFNLGGSHAISISELISIIERHSGIKARICNEPFKDGDVIQTYADISKAGKKLGFYPSIDIDRGISDYIKGVLPVKPIPELVS